MAFPTTSVLDDCNRADENPLSNGGKWGSMAGWDTGPLFLASNKIAGLGSFYGSWWDDSTFGPDCEVYATMSTAPTAGHHVFVDWRWNDGDDSTPNGYQLKVSKVAGAANDEWKVFRIDGGAETQLGATITQEIADGDSFGVSMIGDTITVYHKPAAGSWTSLGTRSDSDYSSAGYIALEAGQDVNTRLDEFGGGTITKTAALTGTITASITESDIVAGGKTIILTLTGDTWIPA